MNRDVCRHFNPADQPCDKCKALTEPEQDELRQWFEERYVRDNYPNNYPSVGMERISSGEYVSPKLEREWQEFLKARTAPAPRKPVELTDEEIAAIASTPCAVVGSYVHTFARAVIAAYEAKQGEQT